MPHQLMFSNIDRSEVITRSNSVEYAINCRIEQRGAQRRGQAPKSTLAVVAVRECVAFLIRLQLAGMRLSPAFSNHTTYMMPPMVRAKGADMSLHLKLGMSNALHPQQDLRRIEVIFNIEVSVFLAEPSNFSQ